MSSYYRHELHQYSTNGGANTWPDCYGGYRNSGAAYGNASGFSHGGAGGFVGGGYDYQGAGAGAGGQFYSGGYGKDSGYYGGRSSYGNEYGSNGGRSSYGNDYSSNGGQMMTAGGGSGGFEIFRNTAQNMAASTVVSGDEMYQSPGSQPGGGGCDLISALVPASFPPGTDPKFIECFNGMDKDRNGSICDWELQSALTTFNQRFSLRTVHLLMFLFTGSNQKDVTPKEFVPLIRSLQSWKASFEMHDRNKNGSMDEMELREAMSRMGYNLSPFVLKLLVSKFDKSGAKSGIEYDYFIECCLIIKGLTDKFKTKEAPYTGTATFTYDEFLFTILPFIIMN